VAAPVSNNLIVYVKLKVKVELYNSMFSGKITALKRNVLPCMGDGRERDAMSRLLLEHLNHDTKGSVLSKLNLSLDSRLLKADLY